MGACLWRSSVQPRWFDEETLERRKWSSDLIQCSHLVLRTCHISMVIASMLEMWKSVWGFIFETWILVHQLSRPSSSSSPSEMRYRVRMEDQGEGWARESYHPLPFFLDAFDPDRLLMKRALRVTRWNSNLIFISPMISSWDPNTITGCTVQSLMIRAETAGFHPCPSSLTHEVYIVWTSFDGWNRTWGTPYPRNQSHGKHRCWGLTVRQLTNQSLITWWWTSELSSWYPHFWFELEITQYQFENSDLQNLSFIPPREVVHQSENENEKSMPTECSMCST